MAHPAFVLRHRRARIGRPDIGHRVDKPVGTARLRGLLGAEIATVEDQSVVRLAVGRPMETRSRRGREMTPSAELFDQLTEFFFNVGPMHLDFY